MIEATERKLREAQFFLQRLVAESAKPVRNEPEAFGFYLSALLSAGKSVVLSFQTRGPKNLHEWFDAWKANRSADDKQLIDYLGRQRDIEIHRDGADVEMAWEHVPVSRLPNERPDHPAYGFTWSSPPGVPEPTVGIPKYRFGADTSERDVVEACKRYVVVLSDMVKEFVENHSP